MYSRIVAALLVLGISASIEAYKLQGMEHHATSHQNTKLESHGHDHEHHEEHYAHPKYKFDYGVQDHHTGDFKSQTEHRDGDSVQGSYTFLEADGTTRVVDYHADKHNGFKAVVKRIGKAHHPAHHSHHSHPGQEETHHEAIIDNVHEQHGDTINDEQFNLEPQETHHSAW